VRRAIAIKPDVALYHANLGEMCRLAGRADEAVAAGRRAIEINPNYPDALSNLGIALFDQGKFEEALGYYDRAIALNEGFALRTAIAATPCSASGASVMPSSPIAAPSNCSRTSPTPGTISAPACANSSVPRRPRPSTARRWN
jgi:tetratricopeptide (TPR) repeat protein